MVKRATIELSYTLFKKDCQYLFYIFFCTLAVFITGKKKNGRQFFKPPAAR
ncbi:hypothetical protein HMPREF9554_01028 [Treponema phagedenis F0421]|nr:hypothetical protein HMPREF9554_01028 [Treponema phagedenis F0421]